MKRFLDFVLSATGILLLSPIIVVVAVLIRVKLGGPVIFRQARPGLGGQPFHMLKFRSMTQERDQAGQLLPDEQRLTRFGSLLRSTSLDELPGLVNVLKGEMSLVGPRPLLLQYLPLYNEFQRRRHEVKPGITGLAQVNGRNALSWDQKFAFDVWYVDNRSTLLDVKILFLTLKKVFKRDGISPDDAVVMPAFTGNPANGSEK